MSDNLDDDGQPRTQAFNWQRRMDSGTDELIGICRGVLADGVLVEEEAKYLFDWLRRNQPVRETFAGQRLFDSLTVTFADQTMSAEEEDLLVDTLLKLTGGVVSPMAGRSRSTQLPLDEPPPVVIFSDRSFCFTGRFTHGTRMKCEQSVVSGGGAIHKYPIRKTSYLVIGDLGSRDWIHSNSGRKIERAIELREEGVPIALISEQHWLGYIC